MAAVIAPPNPARIQITSGIITAAQVNGMDRAHNPIQILPAPGPGLTYIVHYFYISSTRTIDYTAAAGTNFWVSIAGAVPDSFSDTISTVTAVGFLTNTPESGNGSTQLQISDPGGFPYDFTVLVNQPLYLTASDPISSGNGTCKYTLYYSVLSVI